MMGKRVCNVIMIFVLSLSVFSISGCKIFDLFDNDVDYGNKDMSSRIIVEKDFSSDTVVLMESDKIKNKYLVYLEKFDKIDEERYITIMQNKGYCIDRNNFSCYSNAGWIFLNSNKNIVFNISLMRDNVSLYEGKVYIEKAMRGTVEDEANFIEFELINKNNTEDKIQAYFLYSYSVHI